MKSRGAYLRMFSMLFLFLLATAVRTFAGPTAAAFSEANAKYLSGDYAEAARLYDTMAAEGNAPSEVFYNAGNAYAKLKEWGRALVRYERARRVRPRDPEILNNIQHVGEALKYAPSERRYKWLTMLDHLFSYASWFEVLLVSLALYSTWALLAIFSFMAKSSRVLSRMRRIFFTFLLISLIPTSVKFLLTERGEAVVVTREAEVKYGPATGDQTAFKLSEGQSVYVKETRESWLRVALRDGSGGWIARNAVELI